MGTYLLGSTRGKAFTCTSGLILTSSNLTLPYLTLPYLTNYPTLLIHKVPGLICTIKDVGINFRMDVTGN